MNYFEPPRKAEKLLKWFCRASLYDEISGDLFELYQRRVKKLGKRKADWLFWFNVFMFCRPWTWKNKKDQSPNINLAMLKNYLRISWRILAKEKLYTGINLVGFVVGISCFLICFLYLRQEFNYDQFHTNQAQLFRIDHSYIEEGSLSNNAGGPVPLAKAIEEELPGIDKTVRVWSAAKSYLSAEQTFEQENEVVFADLAFYELFSFPLLHGDPSQVLAKPNSVVLSKNSAINYFGNTNPIGKTMKYRGYPAGELELSVTGVMKNLPENTHFNAEVIISLNGVETEADNWGSFKPVYTYLKLAKNASKEDIEGKLPTIASKYLSDRIEGNDTFKFGLINVADIHLKANTRWRLKPGNDANTLWLLACIGGFILLLSCINYINLSAAGSIGRGREIGIRKTLGANKGQLVFQYLCESLVLTFTATALSLLVTWLTVPSIQSYMGIVLNFSVTDVSMIVPLLLVGLFTGLLAGFYPALVVSGFKPVKAIKGQMRLGSSAYRMRKGLVGFQFVISICLIGFTLTINDQINFILNHQLGFDKEAVLVIPYGKGDNETALLNKFNQLPFVNAVSISQSVPANNSGYDGRRAEVPGKEEPVQIRSIISDEAFLSAYKIKLLEGRDFNKNLASDSGAIIINKTAVKELGFESAEQAIGKKVRWSGYFDAYVIGVTEDFHLRSFRDKIAPVMLLYKPHWNWWKGYYSLKLANGQAADTNLSDQISTIATIWKDLYPEEAFRYEFTDQYFENLHQQDLKFRTISRFFTAITLLLACSGLLGITSYQIKRKAKDIAVRKVFGAQTGELFFQLNKEIFITVSVSFTLALPVIIWLRQNWISDFEYQSSLSWWDLGLAGLTGIVLAIGASAYHIFSLANTNPATVIKQE